MLLSQLAALGDFNARQSLGPSHLTPLSFDNLIDTVDMDSVAGGGLPWTAPHRARMVLRTSTGHPDGPAPLQAIRLTASSRGTSSTERTKVR